MRCLDFSVLALATLVLCLSGRVAAADGKAATGTITGKVTVTDNGKQVKGTEVVVYVVGPPDQPGKDVVAAKIKQTADRKFVPDLVAITQNERVAFPNTGRLLHNVFSQKPKFDLGSFGKGRSKDYQFKNYKGIVEVFCNIHPEMAATILVLPNPYHVSANKDGSFTLKGVPVGKWRVFAYTRRATRPVFKRVEVTTGTANVDFTITRGTVAPHKNKYGEKYRPGGGYH